MQRRSFGGHAAAPKVDRNAPYGGFVPPHVNPVHVYLGEGMAMIMWLWIFYRFKQDGACLLGFQHPWDGAHGDDHHHSVHATEFKWEKKVGGRAILIEDDHH